MSTLVRKKLPIGIQSFAKLGELKSLPPQANIGNPQPNYWLRRI